MLHLRVGRHSINIDSWHRHINIPTSELPVTLQRICMCNPNPRIRAFSLLQLRGPANIISCSVLIFMITVRTRHLNALTKRRFRIIRKQHTMETVTAKEHPLGLSLPRFDPCESGKVADAVAWRINEPEAAVAEKVVGVFEGAKGTPFRGFRGGAGELGDVKFGMLRVPDAAVKGALWCSGVGRFGPGQRACATEDLGVGKESAGWKNMVPVGVTNGCGWMRTGLPMCWRFILGWLALQSCI